MIFFPNKWHLIANWGRSRSQELNATGDQIVEQLQDTPSATPAGEGPEDSTPLISPAELIAASIAEPGVGQDGDTAELSSQGHMAAPLPANEEERLQALCGLEVLDSKTKADERFDDITKLVCHSNLLACYSGKREGGGGYFGWCTSNRWLILHIMHACLSPTWLLIWKIDIHKIDLRGSPACILTVHRRKIMVFLNTKDILLHKRDCQCIPGLVFTRTILLPQKVVGV
jgi:hypothetical protein